MSFIMPSRRSTTNLLQASGELWSEDAEEAPLQFIILTPGSAPDPRVDAVVGSVLLLAPDDIALHPVRIDDLQPFDPTFDPTLTEGPHVDIVQRFRDEIAVADAFLLIAPVDDAPAQDLLVRALRWAATPVGEDALAGLPVVWLGLGGEPGAVADVRRQIEAVVEAGGGVMPDDAADLIAPLAGDWADRLGSDGRLEDIPSRQAIGQVLIRLRQIAFSGGEDLPAAADPADMTDG